MRIFAVFCLAMFMAACGNPIGGSRGRTLPEVATMSAGRQHTAAIGRDRSLWVWGSNTSGQLGDGTRNARDRPVQIGATMNWGAVSAGGAHTVALGMNGSLWAWGQNSSGQLGDGTGGRGIDRLEPIQIGRDRNWAQISAGASHTLAVRNDGSLWAWGNNSFGQLGDGTTDNRFAPVRIGIDRNWLYVSAGYWHTLAIKTDGTLWAWGRNDEAQLGDGTISNRFAPVQIGFATDWTSISAGQHHSAAIKLDRSLWVWGSNLSGQLGDGMGYRVSSRHSPNRIEAAMDWNSVSTGQNHTLAIRTDGSLWAWGSNISGQLGDDMEDWGSNRFSLTPIRTGNDTGWTYISAGHEHSVAVRTNGSAWAWGQNSSGQLGIGSDGRGANRHSPARITQ